MVSETRPDDRSRLLLTVYDRCPWPPHAPAPDFLLPSATSPSGLLAAFSVLKLVFHGVGLYPPCQNALFHSYERSFISYIMFNSIKQL